MHLTKKTLQEYCITRTTIELIGENEDGSVDLTPEAIMRLRDAHLELDSLMRFFPWELVPELKAVITKSREQLWAWKARQDREFYRREDSNRELLAAGMCILLNSELLHTKEKDQDAS